MGEEIERAYTREHECFRVYAAVRMPFEIRSLGEMSAVRC